tara:strand:+ start:2005 stop:2778 length:774 start_codon:yes stop_codon:yes gene_type:complete
MRRTLLSEYFIEHARSPGEPPGVKLPTTAIGLYVLAGYARTANNNPNIIGRGKLAFGAEPGWERWTVFVRAFPELRRWLRSPAAFIPPNVWPQAIQNVLPRHVTPRSFALGVLPCNRQQLRNSPFYAGGYLKGLRALSAYAHGWPTTEAELVNMALAAHAIQKVPQFVVWAYNPLLDIVPLPSRDSSYIERSRCRYMLTLDPLGTGNQTLRMALPERARDVEYLLDLPRQEFEPRRSSRKPVIADLSVVARQKKWQI